MTSSFSKCQNLIRANLANIRKIIFGKFNQNRPNRLGCGDDTGKLTDRHTPRQTHIQTLHSLGKSKHIHIHSTASSSLQCYFQQKLQLDQRRFIELDIGELCANVSNASMGDVTLCIPAVERANNQRNKDTHKQCIKETKIQRKHRDK